MSSFNLDMRKLFRLPRSISLTVQLVLTLVGLVVGTTMVLMLVAYDSSRTHLEAQARETARRVAQQHEQSVSRAIEVRHEHAQAFLRSVEGLCGETTARGGVAFEIECLQRGLEIFAASQRARGARFERGGRVLAHVGEPLSVDLVLPAPFARLIRRADTFDYGIRAEHGRSAVTVQFTSEDLSSLFLDRSGLGQRGEVFLVDAVGTFLTPPRYGPFSTPRTAAAAEPIGACQAGTPDVVELDYRGVRTIHGLLSVGLLLEATCVDAHLSLDEALAPADRLWNDLMVRGAMLAIVGALLSIVASQWIASPVRKLAIAARAVQGGYFNRPIPIGGPSEIRALARRFARMARSVADLVTREQAARRDAEVANRMKDDFLATVSHELRTPLTAILGWSHLLRQGRLDAASSTRAMEAIERGAEAQSQLIEDLLDVSSIVAGRLLITRRLLPLTEPIHGALEAVRLQADQKGVQIRSQLDTSNTMVSGDSQRLQQIVSNLLTNAIKFTPSGGTITVRLQCDQRRAYLTVTDTGVGMSPEFLPHAFDRFRQGGNSTDSRKGLGLGLAIVRELVTLHGGEVEASSDGVDRGATIRVTLPLADAQAAVPALTSQGAMQVGLPRLDSIGVLLVDDDAETREMVRTVLEGVGANVQSVASADEARAVMSSWSPGVVISDIAMPDETGYAFVQKLRTSNIHVPAIALTAYGRRGDAEEAIAAGFQAYLAKPVRPSDLVNTVASLAENAKGAWT
jgi:signal transduction histidine kinase/CheY-like chemotaxis protein